LKRKGFWLDAWQVSRYEVTDHEVDCPFSDSCG